MKIAELYATVTADTTQFNANVSGAQKSLTALNGALNKASQTAKRFLLVQGAIAGVSLKLFADAEGTASKFNAVFGSLSTETERWAGTLSENVGRYTNDLKKYLAQLQDTFVPLGFSRDAAAEFSKQLTTLGVDLASFNNLADSSVIDSLTSALVGNHEAVRKFGVLITQASLAAELLNMGIEDGIAKATNMEKVQARLNIIMKSTKDAQGDAARTSGELSNVYKKLVGELKELAVVIGSVIVPAVLSFVKVVSPLIKGLTSLASYVPGLTLALGVLATAAATLVIALNSLSGVLLSLALLAKPVAVSLASFGVAMKAASLAAAATTVRLARFASEAASMNVVMGETTLVMLKFAKVITAAKIAFIGFITAIKSAGFIKGVLIILGALKVAISTLALVLLKAVLPLTAFFTAIITVGLSLRDAIRGTNDFQKAADSLYNFFAGKDPIEIKFKTPDELGIDPKNPFADKDYIKSKKDLDALNDTAPKSDIEKRLAADAEYDSKRLIAYQNTLDSEKTLAIELEKQKLAEKQSLNSLALSQLEDNYARDLITFKQYEDGKIDILNSEFNIKRSIAEKELLFQKTLQDQLGIETARVRLLGIENQRAIDVLNLTKELTRETKRINDEKLKGIAADAEERQKAIILTSETNIKSAKKEIEELKKAEKSASIVSSGSIVSKIQSLVSSKDNKEEIGLLQTQIKNQKEYIALAKETIKAIKEDLNTVISE